MLKNASLCKTKVSITSLIPERMKNHRENMWGVTLFLHIALWQSWEWLLTYTAAPPTHTHTPEVSLDFLGLTRTLSILIYSRCSCCSSSLSGCHFLMHSLLHLPPVEKTALLMNGKIMRTFLFPDPSNSGFQLSSYAIVFTAAVQATAPTTSLRFGLFPTCCMVLKRGKITGGYNACGHVGNV